VYELKPVGKGKWKELVLHRFTDNAHDGSYPGTTLIFDPKGNLFGTTCCGAAYGDGVVFELMRNFDGEWKESVIQDFFGGDYGYSPGALLLGKNGNLYGPAGGGLYGAGLVFELNP
jgi:hypothetical protein